MVSDSCPSLKGINESTKECHEYGEADTSAVVIRRHACRFMVQDTFHS